MMIGTVDFRINDHLRSHLHVMYPKSPSIALVVNDLGMVVVGTWGMCAHYRQWWIQDDGSKTGTVKPQYWEDFPRGAVTLTHNDNRGRARPERDV